MTDNHLDIIKNSSLRLAQFIIMSVSSAFLVAYAFDQVCNCPYAYIHDGTAFKYSGNFFSGAIYKNLERHDLIKIDAINDSTRNLEFKITNKKNENQFINMLDLIAVKHSKSNVLLIFINIMFM